MSFHLCYNRPATDSLGDIFICTGMDNQTHSNEKNAKNQKKNSLYKQSSDWNFHHKNTLVHLLKYIMF